MAIKYKMLLAVLLLCVNKIKGIITLLKWMPFCKSVLEDSKKISFFFLSEHAFFLNQNEACLLGSLVGKPVTFFRWPGQLPFGIRVLCWLTDHVAMLFVHWAPTKSLWLQASWRRAREKEPHPDSHQHATSTAAAEIQDTLLGRAHKNYCCLGTVVLGVVACECMCLRA